MTSQPLLIILALLLQHQTILLSGSGVWILFTPSSHAFVSLGVKDIHGVSSLLLVGSRT